MHPNLGFGCYPSILKLFFRHSKKCFDERVLLSTQKHMSVIFVYYRNCYFCCNLFHLTKSVRLVCSLNVNCGQVRDDQIKINFSSFMSLIRH